MAEKVWFITGTSRGFGREWAIAALERGDKVAATARDTATPGRPGRTSTATRCCRSTLDVTDREADFAAVKQAHDHFGRLDIVVNNAGYGQFGFIEELSEARGARPDRDQRVRRAVGDPGRAALPAGPAQRPHHPGVVDRRHHRLPERRDLPRVEVGAGGLLPVAGAGGRAVRHPRHADRARRLLHRLGRFVVEARPPRCPTTTRCTPRPTVCARSGRPSPAIREHRRRRSSRSSTRPNRRCGCSSGRRRCNWPRPTTRSRLATWEQWQPVAVLAQGAVMTNP